MNQALIVLALISIKLLAHLDRTLTSLSLCVVFAPLELTQMAKKPLIAKLVKQVMFVLEELLEKIQERLRKEGTHALQATIVKLVLLLLILARLLITTRIHQELRNLTV